ncbi:hypothetical protein ACFX5K_06155 [Rickettsiales bacterium LUAb2]
MEQHNNTFFNPNLETRLNRLEAEFKKNNFQGYKQRIKLKKSIFVEEDGATSHEMYDNKNIKFYIIFKKEEWTLVDENKDSSDVFHANDITRLQYIEAAKKSKCMGYLPKRILIFNISNETTKNILKQTSNEDLAHVFPNTLYGKRIHYLFSDFGLIIRNIEFKEDEDGSFSKNNIIIHTGYHT